MSKRGGSALDLLRTSVNLAQSATMQSIVVQPGKHISPDVGLSDIFTVRALDDAGDAVLFDLEPREWLAEFEIVRLAQLPAGATYSRLLSLGGSRFIVRFSENAEGTRFWKFTLFDISRRRECILTLSEQEASALAEQIRQALLR